MSVIRRRRNGITEAEVLLLIQMNAEQHHGIVPTVADLTTLIAAKLGDEAHVASDNTTYELIGIDPTVIADWIATTVLISLATADSTTYSADGTTVTADAV